MPESVRAHDAVGIAIDHSGFIYGIVHAVGQLIVDTWNAFRSRAAQTEPAYAARDPQVAKLARPRRASTS